MAECCPRYNQHTVPVFVENRDVSQQKTKDSLHMNIPTMVGNEYCAFLGIPVKMPGVKE